VIGRCRQGRQRSDRVVVTGLVMTRVVAGLSLLLIPERVGRVWLTSNGATRYWRGLRWIGVRDVAIAVGAFSSRSSSRTWMRVGVVADVFDAVASMLLAVRLRSWRPVLAVFPAAAGAVLGARHAHASAGDAW